MKISVALASYNGEKYILEQLASILDQTVQVDEVVIVDDRSTDRTAEVVEDFIKNHGLKDWKFVVNDKNLGFAANFHKAISFCEGDLIFPCDQDDVWVKNRVEVMSRIMADNPCIGLLNTASVGLKDGRAPFYSKNDTVPRKIDIDRHSFFLKYPGCVMCFKKDLYCKYKGYARSSWPHDTFLWSMALLDGSCYEVSYCSLLRRSHSEQTSGRLSHSRKKRIAFLDETVFDFNALYNCAVDAGKSKKLQRFYKRRVKAAKYRLNLVKNCRIYLIFALLFYIDCYQTPRSFVIEPIIALKKGNYE